VSLDDWLKSNHYPTRLEGILVSAKLPLLKDGPELWWKQRILPMVKDEFSRISKRPIRNTALWEELKAKTSKFTPSAMRRLMEKNCRNKLLRIAKAAHKMPAHGHT
jgi:hypothetical protein